jgi:diguanylate cyclase (GGDEF)-like protein
MKLSIKLILTILLGLSALSALFLFKSFSNDYFIHRNAVELAFKEIETAHRQLDYQILHNTFFLYTNQDDVNHKISLITHRIQTLLHNKHIVDGHPKTLKMLQKHANAFDAKVQAIYDFQTANTVIKNSTAAILALQHRLFALNADNPEEQELFREINRISGTILLAKNGMDSQLITSLHSSIDSLAHKQLRDPLKNDLLQRSIAHFRVIEEYFPRYVSHLAQINDPEVILSLQKSNRTFQAESNRELRLITYFSYLLIALFIISIGVITFFLIRSEKEARRDPMTRLRNRKAYEERIRHTSHTLSLILININKFKHYNDFYGVEAGDRLLIETARRIKTMRFQGNYATYYRLGADDFGILFEESPEFSLEEAAKSVLRLFPEQPIVIDGEVRTPSLTVAASNTAPLLENADMALKSKHHNNPIFYHEGLNLRQIIEDNVTKAKELREALKEGRIIPYFQPIIDLSNRRVAKHEVLARVVVNDGEVRSIYPYLHIAKESRLYNDLSRLIITKSFAIIADHPGDFSINLSIDDIEHPETVELVTRLLETYEGIGNRIIFEILESEAIEKYEGVLNFIAHVRRYGCRIAIDDFGSGYSNFAHILNLAVDIIKIDGSLIRHLDTDGKAVTIVQTIVNFTQSASIQTVAEFVHNEAVADIVRNLGIDAAQGFYFYEPSPLPITPA